MRSTSAILTESEVEDAGLEWLCAIGWQTAHGPDISPDGSNEERSNYDFIILEQRLRNALVRFNPELPVQALDDAFRKLIRSEGSTLEARNRDFHRMLVRGVPVEYRMADGVIRGAQVVAVDYANPAANDFLAVNQMTVTERNHTRRPDIVLFVNGLPLGVIELKNPTDEEADIWVAWRQLQTYKAELPSLFSMNELLIVSDGTEARLGTLTAGQEWFKPWRMVGDDGLKTSVEPELSVLLSEVCAPERLLSLLRDFIVFEDDGSGSLVKKMAGYHQFHAVQRAVSETLRAAMLQASSEVEEEPGDYEIGGRPGSEPGDRRIGVVWHTQGAGKSLSMAYYAGAIAREPAMENPTIVVLTDRNDLDDQLFGTFARCQDLLGQPPVQAESRADLRRKLSVVSGGVVFTTIHKFSPERVYGKEAWGRKRRVGSRIHWPNERIYPRSSCHTLHRPLMERQPYDTDLSDAEWDRIRPLLPAPCTRGRPIAVPRREIVNAILYVLRAGCAWRLWPHDLPRWTLVYWYFQVWRAHGLWARISAALRGQLRRAEGRKTAPSAGILDSQSVKTTETPGLRGYDAGKKVKGRQRHLVVDTLGLPLRVAVQAADVQDRDGARQVLDRLQDDFPRLRVVWADEGYRGPKLGDWVKGQGTWQLDIVRRNPDAEGFEVLPKRWIVERTFAWLGRYRRLSKDYERRLDSSETWIHIALSRCMLKRLSKA